MSNVTNIFKKRCKHCLMVTVSRTPLYNGDPCEPCTDLFGVRTPDSVLVDYWKPFPDSA